MRSTLYVVDGMIGKRDSESSEQDQSVKCGGQGVCCHVHSLGFPLQETAVKAFNKELR